MLSQKIMIDEGIYLEYRVMRLFNEMGYFSRRGIPLKHYFYPETIDITDIDVYGITWNNDFSTNTIIAQCKSGRSKTERKTANPIMWLSGLKKFLKSDRAYLVKVYITTKLIDFALKNDIIPIDVTRLNNLEEKLNLVEWNGSYAINNYKLQKEYHKEIQKDTKKIKNHYLFVTSDYWGLSSNLQIKKFITYINNLLTTLSLETDTYQWLLIESVVLFSVSLLNFCKEISPYNTSDREQYIKICMIEGISNIEDQEKILKITQSLISAYIKEKTGESITFDQNIQIPPPDYTEKLTELIERLISRPTLSVKIPHFMDYYLYETKIKNKIVEKSTLQQKYNLNVHEVDILAKLCKNIIRFLDPNADQRKAFDSILKL